MRQLVAELVRQHVASVNTISLRHWNQVGSKISFTLYTLAAETSDCTLHWHRGLTAAIFFGPAVCCAPDLRQTDGGMEPVEDDERDAQVADDGPRQMPVDVAVDRQVLDLLHLEDADDPEAEIEQEEERDQGSSRLEVGLC